VGKCDGCGESLTSSNLIWNAVKNWKSKLDNKDISNYFILDQNLPLSRERIDCLAMRYCYDMEHFNRFKCDKMEKILLFYFDLMSMISIIVRVALKKQNITTNPTVRPIIPINNSLCRNP
jgi:hypothetical protein